MFFWFAKKNYDNINFNSLIFRLFSCCTCFWIRSGYNFITKIFFCAIYFLLSKAGFRSTVWLEVLQCVLAVVCYFFFFFSLNDKRSGFVFLRICVFRSHSRNVYIYLIFTFSVMFLVSIDVDACHRFEPFRMKLCDVLLENWTQTLCETHRIYFLVHSLTHT